jgi:glycosyltransferase involved in cell wall biosynthesis
MKSQKNKPRVVVVMPAFNAEKTLRQTYADIPKDVVDEVIVVDDHSGDKTVEVARKLGLKVLVHPQNRGYGGNQKTCYTMALNEGAGIVVMIHPDYQYDPRLAGELVSPIASGRVDIMLGSRIRSRAEALAGGMPLYKYLGNRLLTMVENLILGLNLSEYHTGYRAFSRKALEKLPFHKFSDDFVFDQEMLICAAGRGLRMGEIAVPVKYFAEASSINFFRSVKYGLATLVALGRYLMWGAIK